MNKDIYQVYTDGSARNVREVGGWAFVVYKNDKIIKIEYENGIQDITVNRMEIIALLGALKWTRENTFPCDKVIIYCDSAYTVNMFNDWVRMMAARGWKKADRKTTPENLDLLKELLTYAEIGFTNFSVVKVSGHTGVEGNEVADAFASGNESKIEDFIKRGVFSYEDI